MNKILYSMAVMAGLMSLASCDEYDDRYVAEYASVVRLDTYGEQSLVLWSTDAESGYDFKVLRSGHDMSSTTTATVRVMTDEEWKDYTALYGIQRYFKLSADCYEFAGAADGATGVTLEFAAKQSANDVNLKFYPSKVNDFIQTLPPTLHEGSEWANVACLPMVLESADGSVYKEQKNMLLLLSYKKPVLKMSPTGFTKLMCRSSDVPYIRDYTVSMGSNPWGFTLKARNEQELLDQYNKENGTRYTLIKPGALEIDMGDAWQPWSDQVLDFAEGTTDVKFRVRINPDKVEPMDVMALHLSDPTVDIDMDETDVTDFVAIAVKPSGIRLKVKAEDVTASNQMADYPAGNLVDGKSNTFYHSVFSAHDGDPVYGTYVDMKLPKAVRYFSFDYTSRCDYFGDGRGIPNEVHIYVSNDGQTWERCGEIKNMRRDFNTTSQTVSYGNFDALVPVTYVRWAVVMGGAEGDVDMRAKNTTGHWTATALYIYGK